MVVRCTVILELNFHSTVIWNRIRRNRGLYTWANSQAGPQANSDFRVTDSVYTIFNLKMTTLI